MKQDDLRSILHYAPETGVWTWIVRPAARTPMGALAGCVSHGYLNIKYKRKGYKAHRLAWLYMTGSFPSAQIDHINGDPGDCRWSNLRIATHGQNTANSKLRSDNAAGCKGVSWHKGTGRWSARIQVDGTRKTIGYFKSREEAHAAYVTAAIAGFGEFARAA